MACYERNKRDSSVSHPAGAFFVYGRAGARLRRPEWMDTANLAPNESLDLIMEFTDPIIRGVSVFHCHLLKHVDKGMMAKILFE